MSIVTFDKGVSENFFRCPEWFWCGTGVVSRLHRVIPGWFRVGLRVFLCGCSRVIEWFSRNTLRSIPGCYPQGYFQGVPAMISVKSCFEKCRFSIERPRHTLHSKLCVNQFTGFLDVTVLTILNIARYAFKATNEQTKLGQ